MDFLDVRLLDIVDAFIHRLVPAPAPELTEEGVKDVPYIPTTEEVTGSVTGLPVGPPSTTTLSAGPPSTAGLNFTTVSEIDPQAEQPLAESTEWDHVESAPTEAFPITTELGDSIVEVSTNGMPARERASNLILRFPVDLCQFFARSRLSIKPPLIGRMMCRLVTERMKPKQSPMEISRTQLPGMMMASKRPAVGPGHGAEASAAIVEDIVVTEVSEVNEAVRMPPPLLVSDSST